MLDNRIRNLQIENERLKFQISQVEEENHLHRLELERAAKEQALLETAVRALCFHLIEFQNIRIDDVNQTCMDTMALIRYADTIIGEIAQDHTNQITDLLQMLRRYQVAMRDLQQEGHSDGDV